jgi:hypothetical protein
MRQGTRRTLLAAIVGLGLTGGLTACAGPTSATPSTVSLPVSFVASTSLGPSGSGPFQLAGSRVVSDSSTWAAIWAQMFANDSETPALPTIDFSTSTLLVAWMGSRATSGYGISIPSVTETAGVVSANVTWTSPGPSCGTLQVVTTPVVVVSIPHQDSASVQFEVSQTTDACGS